MLVELEMVVYLHIIQIQWVERYQFTLIPLNFY